MHQKLEMAAVGRRNWKGENHSVLRVISVVLVMGTTVRREKGPTGNRSAVSETWRGLERGSAPVWLSQGLYRLTAPENHHSLVGDVETRGRRCSVKC